jgi:hypothetical protein
LIRAISHVALLPKGASGCRIIRNVEIARVALSSPSVDTKCKVGATNVSGAQSQAHSRAVTWRDAQAASVPSNARKRLRRPGAEVAK